MKKRILSLLLCLVMVLGLLPTAAFAAESGETTGSGTETDPYCVSTYAEMKRLLENRSSSNDVYIKVVGIDDETVLNWRGRYLRYGTDYGYSGCAIEVYGKKHLEIPKGINLSFIADPIADYNNRLLQLIYIGSDAELNITGEGSIHVEFNHSANGYNNITQLSQLISLNKA